MIDYWWLTTMLDSFAVVYCPIALRSFLLLDFLFPFPQTNFFKPQFINRLSPPPFLILFRVYSYIMWLPLHNKRYIITTTQHFKRHNNYTHCTHCIQTQIWRYVICKLMITNIHATRHNELNRLDHFIIHTIYLSKASFIHHSSFIRYICSKQDSFIIHFIPSQTTTTHSTREDFMYKLLPDQIHPYNNLCNTWWMYTGEWNQT